MRPHPYKIFLFCTGFLFLIRIGFSQGFWTKKTNYANGTSSGGYLIYVDEGVGFSIGTKGYIGTGQYTAGFNPTSNPLWFWSWDQGTNTWTQIANFAGPGRMSGIAFTINGRGYVGTGIDVNNVIYNDLWEYNPGTNTWTAKANCPVSTSDAVGFAVGNYGYITGNTNLYRYSPASNTWTYMSAFPAAYRNAASAFSIGTKGYVGIGNNGTTFQDFWEWDSGTNTWTAKANFPISLYNAASFSIGTMGYIGTGDTCDLCVSREFWGWDQTSNTWMQLPYYPGAKRESAVAFSIGCKGYLGVSDEYDYQGHTFQDYYEYTPDIPHLANAGDDTLICKGGSVQLAAVTGTGYRYSWTPATGLSNDTIYNPVASPADTTQYILTVTTPQGCTGKDTVIVNVGNISVSVLPKTSYFCAGTADTLIAAANAAATYSWSPAAGLSCATCAKTGASPGGPTDYIVTATSIAGGCISKDTAHVLVATGKAGAGVTICPGDSTTISASGGITYSWSPSATLINPNTATPIAHPTMPTNYTVTVTTGTCVFKDSIFVNVSNNLVVDAGRDTTICPGKNVTLSASGGKKYSWIPTTGLSNPNIFNPVATPAVTTNYIVNITSGGCSAKDSVLVTVDSLPKAAAGNDTVICKGASVNLSASGGGTYLWSPSAGLTCSTCAGTSATPIATTKYIVTVKDATGCSNKDSMTVTVNNLPTANAGSDVTIKLGQSVTLNGSGGINYLWLPGNELSDPKIANPIATPTNTTVYILVVADANNCLNEDTVTVTVIKPSCVGSDEDLFVANIFSPNGDGKNDVLQLKGNGITNVYWAIYDRWGNLLFESTDQSQGWDGTKKGSPMGTDTYVYYIKATCIKTNSELRMKGNVTLMR